ncbi:MAG: nucleotidyltransferase family protein [Bacteroidetes bacterium]|nr:nucleotidyltransferase family protein [Bacteroidota bacterium]
MKEAIILAGGLGTRLRDAVPGLPKCMAPVNGKPFIDYIVDYLRQQKIQRFIFSVGYMHETISTHIQHVFPYLDSTFIFEEKPLGTGGAVYLSANSVKDENVLVLNGDTLFKINLASLSKLHFEKNAHCTLALKPMVHFERYGVVEMDEEKRIVQFHEKRKYAEGLINGGVYCLNIPSFLQCSWTEKFSFEKDYLENPSAGKKLYGDIQDTYFIDIGIPEDYLRAQEELK